MKTITSPLSEAGLILLVIFAFLAPCLPIATNAAVFPIDPRNTYLRTHPDDVGALDAIPFSLAVLGIAPGDFIQLEATGDYRHRPDFPDAIPYMLGVFSGSNVLLPRDEPNRVFNAIDTGVDTLTGDVGGVETDIPEDFFIPDSSGVIVQVPVGATHLFVTAWDIWFGDNDDPDGDFAVRIELVCPNASFGPDGIIWHQPLARNGASEDTDPGVGNTLKYRFKQGSTIPIKIHVVNCDGVDVTASPNVVGVVEVFEATGCEGTADGNALTIDYHGVGGAGGAMEKVSGHLMYNLDTSLLPPTASCYLLQVTVTDASTGESLSETVPLQAK